MSLELVAAGAMLVGLLLYAVTGGADFGGGIWDLLARGPRAARQRAAIEGALAPVWEANHVWLIFVLITLYTAFPPAFASIGIELHVPLTILLLGIVLRGSAFVFRQYGAEGPDGPREQTARRWGLMFAVSSLVAPWFLGIILGAMTSGGTWWGPFPIVVGLFAVVTFAFLAAVYLTVEVQDPELKADFRRRALVSGIGMLLVAAASAALAHRVAPHFAARLVGSWWMAPILAFTTACALGTLIALRIHRDRLARALAIACVVMILGGWGTAQYPYLLAPDLRLEEAAAPAATLRVLVPILVGGAAVLLLCLWWLMRVFKADRARSAPS